MTEKLKPLFIAGVLIALQDEGFSNDYDKITSFSTLLDSSLSAIERVLSDGEISNNKIKEIKSKFSEIGSVIKLRATPLSDDNSLRWYINQLEMKIKPMMDYVGNTIDALGIFYHEFISYSSGDGNSLGIVLTPQHLTEFMVDLINIDKDSRVVDICCGSGAFLVTAMGKMFKEAATPEDIEYIRKNNLYGIEQDSDIHTLALANMIMRKDGKSHILHGDCFDKNTIKKFKNLKDTEGNEIVLNKGLLNPPYSQKDHVELEFLEQELELITQGGEVAVVCPMSCAIGTKFKDVRERLMQKHTLKAVFSMPDDIFYGQGAGTCVCVMVWEAKKKHNPNISTFFGYYKEDGFVKRKKLGRIDAHEKWESIKTEWLRLYHEKEVIDGLTAKSCVNHKSEWLCEAYMKTDFSILSRQDFQQSVNDYLSYLVKNEYTNLEKKYKIENNTEHLDIENWKEFKLEDLFTICAGKYHYSYEYDSGLTPYVSASNTNNGIAQKINLESDFKGNSLVTGKVGCTAFYQPFDFCATSDVNVFTPKFELNYAIGLFIVTVINKGENYKWNYGRQCRVGDSKEIVIKLPIKTNEDGTPYIDQRYQYSKKGYVPDWEYMEKYIKSLPYSNRI